MAKKNSNNPLFTIDILLDKFTDYLRDQNFSEDSIVKYKGVHVFFDSDFRGQVMKDQERNFMDLVPKLLCTKSFSGRYMDRNGKIIPVLTGWDIIDNIITGIDNDLFKNITLPQKTKTESNYQSYANKFFKFIKTVYGNKKSKYNITKLTKGYNRPSLSAADLAVLAGTQGEIYLHNSLCTKFKSRLRSQDRTSGDKIWLPLRFIGKIYSKAKKLNYITVNSFLDWLDNLVNSINIHYNDNGTVKHFTIYQGVSLWLSPNNSGFDVKIIDSFGNPHIVLTPTGKGNEKIPMIVKSISEIAIDHVKSIDRTLRDLSDEVNNYTNNKLPQLMKVSDKYKAIQAEDDPNEDLAIKELLPSLDLQKLINELYLIKNDGLLRLMASKYNSQKSNGETFQGIYMRKDGSYYGVIETRITKKGEDGTFFTLYQELTDYLNDTGKLTIDKEDNLKGKEIADLRDIIDRI